MQDMEQIYEEYFETVYKYLFCLTHNSDISEELTQETFYRAVKKIHSFKGECKISGTGRESYPLVLHPEDAFSTAQRVPLLSLPPLWPTTPRAPRPRQNFYHLS